MKSYLAIDYGQVHLGLAIATTELAEPFKVISRKGAIETIKKLTDTLAITDIIIGLSEGAMAAETKAFGQELAKATGLPLHFHDETLSSQETRLLAARAGMKKSRRQGKIDHLVAAHILQDFLDSREPD
jgi:putative holliday junction resolvase